MIIDHINRTAGPREDVAKQLDDERGTTGRGAGCRENASTAPSTSKKNLYSLRRIVYAEKHIEKDNPRRAEADFHPIALKILTYSSFRT